MSRRSIVEIGATYGRLTVEALSGRDEYGSVLCRCKCSCGRMKEVRASYLVHGRVVSCGCKKSENARNARGYHGRTKEPLYTVWSCMLQRCYNKESTGFCNYGGRGITVCEEWHDFRAFYEWATAEGGYQPGLSIERVDVNGMYSPGNCTFIPRAKQAENTRKTIRYNGKCLKTYCSKVGLSYTTIYSRIRTLGWSVEKAVQTPINNKEANYGRKQQRTGKAHRLPRL